VKLVRYRCRALAELGRVLGLSGWASGKYWRVIALDGVWCGGEGWGRGTYGKISLIGREDGRGREGDGKGRRDGEGRMDGKRSGEVKGGNSLQHRRTDYSRCIGHQASGPPRAAQRNMRDGFSRVRAPL